MKQSFASSMAHNMSKEYTRMKKVASEDILNDTPESDVFDPDADPETRLDLSDDSVDSLLDKSLEDVDQEDPYKTHDELRSLEQQEAFEDLIKQPLTEKSEHPFGMEFLGDDVDLEDGDEADSDSPPITTGTAPSTPGAPAAPGAPGAQPAAPTPGQTKTAFAYIEMFVKASAACDSLGLESVATDLLKAAAALKKFVPFKKKDKKDEKESTKSSKKEDKESKKPAKKKTASQELFEDMMVIEAARKGKKKVVVETKSSKKEEEAKSSKKDSKKDEKKVKKAQAPEQISSANDLLRIKFADISKKVDHASVSDGRMSLNVKEQYKSDIPAMVKTLLLAKEEFKKWGVRSMTINEVNVF